MRSKFKVFVLIAPWFTIRLIFDFLLIHSSENSIKPCHQQLCLDVKLNKLSIEKPLKKKTLWIAEIWNTVAPLFVVWWEPATLQPIAVIQNSDKEVGNPGFSPSLEYHLKMSAWNLGSQFWQPLEFLIPNMTLFLQDVTQCKQWSSEIVGIFFLIWNYLVSWVKPKKP